MMRYVALFSARKVCDWVNEHPEYHVVAITPRLDLNQYIIFYEDINRQITVPIGAPIVVPPMQDWKLPPATCDSSKDRTQTTCTQVCEGM